MPDYTGKLFKKLICRLLFFRAWIEFLSVNLNENLKKRLNFYNPSKW